MNTNNRTLWIAAGLVLFCGFLLLVTFVVSGLGRLAGPASSPTIDLFATLAASTPLSEFLSRTDPANSYFPLRFF
jgi:hypothetical protein